MLIIICWEVVEDINLDGKIISIPGSAWSEFGRFFYPRGGQPTCSFFSEEDKQEFTKMEGLAPEGEKFKTPYSERVTPRQNMAVVKWQEKV